MQTAEKQNDNGHGFMSRFFRKQSNAIKEPETITNQNQKETPNGKEPVYHEYIRKFSAFSFFDNDKDQTKDNPITSKPKLNGLSEQQTIDETPPNDIKFASDIVLHPQRNMFSDADWKCLEFKD